LEEKVSAQLRPYLIFWSLGLIAFSAEYLFPARNVPYRAVFFRDLVALGVYNLSFLLVLPVSDRIPIPNYVPTSLMKLPLVYKLILFYIVEDFGLYWVHRLMHTNQFWRTHRWHHYPNYMYWLAGVRTSIPHIFLFNVTFVIARPLLSGAPLWLFQFIAFEHILRNHWMHLNVSWNSRWLEYLVVTPRYHHVHHSNDPAHYRSNLGALLTVWDRIFGTYTDPSNVKKPLRFGIGQRVAPYRLILGV
jgi:sterol desaturase/sphingolipid hydroxylase (fatty acid hydroxylase superfamily)